MAFVHTTIETSELMLEIIGAEKRDLDVQSLSGRYLTLVSKK